MLGADKIPLPDACMLISSTTAFADFDREIIADLNALWDELTADPLGLDTRITQEAGRCHSRLSTTPESDNWGRTRPTRTSERSRS